MGILVIVAVGITFCIMIFFVFVTVLVRAALVDYARARIDVSSTAPN